MSVDERLQRYLDGELPLGELPAELHAEARAWEALLDDARRAAPAGAPPGLENRILAGVRVTARRPKRKAWLDWLLRPRPVPVSPLALALGSVLIVLVALLPWALSGRGEMAGGASGRVLVQFVVQAPAAETVHVVGDFNDWQPTIPLTDPDGDGVWSGRVALAPGVHEYMFVVDGSNWITDPNASSYQDDGFGQRNAVVAVAPLSET